MLVSVIQVKFDYTTGKYALKEVALNPEYVVSVDEESKVSQELRVYEAKRPEGLDPRVTTSSITLAGGKVLTVLGAPSVIMEKLSIKQGNRTILRG